MAVITTGGSGVWSSTTVNAPWSTGVVPVEGDSVVIALGHTVTVDGTYTAGDDTVTAFTVNGTLKASRTVNSSLTVKGQIFTAAATTATIDFGRKSTSDPIPSGITATLILNKSAAMVSYKYGLFVADTSNFYACGATKNNNARLTANLAISGTSVTVDDATAWAVGDTIVFAPSDGTYNHYDKKTILTLTPGAGTTATITFAAVTYAHATNCPIGNITSNVTIKNFNTSTYAFLCFRHTSTASNSRREMDYVSLQNVGSNSALTNTQVFVSAGTSALTTPFVSLSHNTAYNCNGTSIGQFIITWNSGGFYLDNWSFFADDGAGGPQTYTASGSFYGIKNSVYYYHLGRAHISAFSQGGQGCLFTDNTYCGANTNFFDWSNGDGGLFTRCGFHTSATAVAYLNMSSGSAKFVNCNFGYTGAISGSTPILWGTTYSDYIINCPTQASKGDWTITDSYFLTPNTSFDIPANVSLSNPQWITTVVNKDNTTTSQEIYVPGGALIRDNSIIYRGTSSVRVDTLSTPISTKNVTFTAESGTAYTIIGYLRKNSTYGASTLPNVSLTGGSITPQTFTMTNSVDTWEKFTLTFTQSTGSPATMTLAYNAQSATATGKAYFDGVPQFPFINSARHYGYLFDTNVYRTVDSIISQTNETTVGAYTGISISGSTITLTSSHTIREIYDYCKWYLCQTANLSVADFFTSTDGVNFTSSYNLTLNGGSITGTGNLSLGSKTFTRVGSESSTVPITYNSGAAVFGNITVSGLIANSRVYLNNTTDNISLYNAVVVGTSVTIPTTWTANKSLELRVTNVIGTTAYSPYSTTGTLTSTLPSFTVSQVLDSVYNSNGINGSSVTEFVADYPHIQVDINDGDGVTSVKRLYAAFEYMMHSSQGIVYFFNGITAQDILNYQVNTSVVGLTLDNVGTLPVVIADAYLFRDDGASIIASLSPSIQMDPKRAYGVGISGAKIFNTKNREVSIIL